MDAYFTITQADVEAGRFNSRENPMSRAIVRAMHEEGWYGDTCIVEYDDDRGEGSFLFGPDVPGANRMLMERYELSDEAVSWIRSYVDSEGEEAPTATILLWEDWEDSVDHEYHDLATPERERLLFPGLAC